MYFCSTVIDVNAGDSQKSLLPQQEQCSAALSLGTLSNPAQLDLFVELHEHERKVKLGGCFSGFFSPP